MLSTVVLLSLALAAPGEAFTAPASPEPEYGYGLTAEEALEGWISLFDGQTDFGWAGAKVERGLLSGGRTTLPLCDYELKALVARPGTLEIGGQALAVRPGIVERRVEGGPVSPIVLGDGLAVARLAIRPLGVKPLFNAQNLQGWKVITHPRLPPERQARWSVEEGAIRAVGGPGALEYAEPLGDLVVQVEVRARAELVNGGVFVRSQPGEFLNGYEAQIFNACYGGDPARPARYSTGAIDDRQLARRLVSRDGVPFVMTVIAVGPRLATWVNGHAMTDWLDTRPLHDNPRQGLRLEPGTLQLQAHDAGTDIEFRAVRGATWGRGG